MEALDSIWRDRIEHWIRTLKEDFYQPLGEISLKAYRTEEHLLYEEIQNREFFAVEPGFTWGNIYEYCWFKGDFVLPKEAEGERIVLNLNPGGESTLFVNGQEFGTYRADWVANPHHYFVDNMISMSGKSGEAYDFCMETYAGHYFPNVEYCATGPVLPGSFQDPAEEGKRRILGKCTYGIFREEAYQLYMDVSTLYSLWSVLNPSSLRAVKIAQALKQFTYDVDFEQEAEGRRKDYEKARENLKICLEAVNGSTMPVFSAVGNAHIDLAWLWPVAETERKTARTFAAQLRLLDEYPEYRFIQSQPAAYELCRKFYPGLFERIKEKIKEGQWIADGAMWVEPDTNMAGGEALIRQLIYGKKYYKEVLGVDSRVLWLPDTFGYTAALPQILLGCDVPYLITQKIFWCCNDGERFPYHYFYWEGMDGSQVTSFLPTSYTYQTTPEELGNVWEQREQKEDLETFFLPFGYGDGGGGPCRDHIEYALRQKNLEGSPKVQMESPEEFFKRMEEDGGPVHTYSGELYFSSHRGTYTSQANIKKDNRRSETALREMEFWGSLAMLNGGNYDMEEAENLWKTFLFQQFHDILPGSSIERVYKEAEKSHREVQEKAEKRIEEAIRCLLKEEKAAVVTNSLSFERKEVVVLPEEFENGAVTEGGEEIPVQKTEQGIKALVTLPSCGWVTVYPSDEAKEKHSNVKAYADGEGYHLENDKIHAVINEKGEVISFKRKDSNREFASAPMNRFHIYKDVPRHFDAWDIDDNYINQELEGAFEQKVSILSEGLIGTLLVEGKIGNSFYEQRICLAAESERMEFETTVSWQELHRLLKVSFPVNVMTLNAKNEMQFGYVERPTHRSRTYDKDRFEVCNHKYTALCDNSHGAAILNDCKYGISVEKNSMNLTLLRAASSPEMRADNGIHHFTYAFYAWEGDFAECDVVRQGYALNIKPGIFDGDGKEYSFLCINRKNIIMEALKPAEDGSRDLILRVYESCGAAVNAEFVFGSQVERICECNMLEQELKELRMEEKKLTLSFRAFEIKTLRIKTLSFYR